MKTICKFKRCLSLDYYYYQTVQTVQLWNMNKNPSLETVEKCFIRLDVYARVHTARTQIKSMTKIRFALCHLAQTTKAIHAEPPKWKGINHFCSVPFNSFKWCNYWKIVLKQINCHLMREELVYAWSNKTNAFWVAVWGVRLKYEKDIVNGERWMSHGPFVIESI